MENMERAPVKFGKRGFIYLLLALVIAGAYQFLHGSLFSLRGFHLPGIGFTISQWLIVAAVLIPAIREKKAKISWQGIFLLVCALGMGLCYGIFANDWMRLLNLPAFFLLTSMALFSLTGKAQQAVLSWNGLKESFCRFFSSMFHHVGVPFRAAGEMARERTGKLRGLGLGILLGVVAMLIAASLLASADQFFDGMVKNAFSSMGRINGISVRRLLFTALFGLLIFSSLYSFYGEGEQYFFTPVKRSAPPLTFAAILSMIACIYGLFVYVQFRFLFGNEQTALSAGGYAEYARTGFFQLVLLSALTLLLILPALSLCGESKAVRILCAVVALLTTVIDFSAFYRMRLYIAEYGLSLLRMLTLWAMAVIFGALMLALVKCIRPGFRFAPVWLVIVFGSWLALNMINMDACIARHNIRAFEQGTVAKLDAEYLCSLSPDVLPAIREISDPALREEMLAKAEKHFAPNQPMAYDWALSWLKVK